MILAPSDYRQKYAEDPPYTELDPEARVWLVYNDESAIFDNDMIIESGDNLDILLVFVCCIFIGFSRPAALTFG